MCKDLKKGRHRCFCHGLIMGNIDFVAIFSNAEGSIFCFVENEKDTRAFNKK